MHTIAFIVDEKKYHMMPDDIFYYKGLIFLTPKFGEFLIMFCDIDLNVLASKINFPIQNFFINRNEAINAYIEECQEILSQYYNPIIASLILNEVEDVLLNAKAQDMDVKMNEAFQAFAIAQICINEFMQGNWAKLKDFLQLQQISTKFALSDSGQLQQIFFLNDIYSLLCIELLNLQTHNITIKICENCKRLFLTQNRTDEIYCDRFFKDNKTCKDVGYIEKVKKRDEFMRIYTKARKTQHARIRYNAHISNYKEKHFEPWKKAAEKARDNFRNNNDIEGFKKWLEDHKDYY